MRKEMPSDSQSEEVLQYVYPLHNGEMSNPAIPHHASTQTFSYETTDELVEHLTQVLYPCIKGWVYHSNVACWKGQEYDLVADLLQTALMKIITYLEHCRLAKIPIYSLEQLSKVIAKRCFLDLMRRDRRLQRFDTVENEMSRIDLLVDPAQQAEESVYEEELLISSARIIATFPAKLRQAILVDLGRGSTFASTPTTLQQAFLDVGIQLQEYAQQVPTSIAERNKQTALRSLAYKRVAQEIRAQETGTVEEDVACIQDDAELISLALHLQQTRQCVAAHSFRERLRTQLMASKGQALPKREILTPSALPKALVCASKAARSSLAGIKEKGVHYLSVHDDDSSLAPHVNQVIAQQFLVASSEQPGEDILHLDAFSNQAHATGHDRPDMTTILADSELDWLAKLLHTAVRPVTIDPAFREALRQQLLKQLRTWHEEEQNL